MLNAPVLLGRSSINILHFLSIVRVLDLLRARCRRERILDAPSHNVVLEQQVNRLERDTLCLRDAENGPDAHDDAAGSEKEESAVRDFGEHDCWAEVSFTSRTVEERID